MPELLSSSLYREVRDPAFFRVLASRNAPTYIDVLDALDQECTDRPDGLGREEALELISEVLERHPDYEPEQTTEGELNTATLTLREKARTVLDHLMRCRWLEEPPRRDWQRRLYFDAHGATLMTALRKVAHPDAAVFTDKLIAVCAMLSNEAELIERPWQAVENCLSSAKQGLNELRTMQKSVQRFTRRQLEESTLRGNLAVVFDDYAEQVAHACYAELIRARLPVRLPEAVKQIGDRLLGDAGAMALMQTEVLRRHPEMSAETARAQVRCTLDELVHLLEMVLPMADEIDRRTADFTRRSLARFRYLQDVTGERRSEVRAFFEQVNRHLSGKRLSSPWELVEMPALSVPEAEMPFGIDSLRPPSKRRPPAEHEAMDDDVTDEDRAEGTRNMQRALREKWSVHRANEFVKQLPGGKGARLGAAELGIKKPSELTAIIALMLHAESNEARYRLEAARVQNEDSSPALDALPGARVEHFDLIKK